MYLNLFLFVLVFMVEIVNRLNKTKKFLYTPEIEGEAAKRMISEITDRLPLSREYKASRVGDSSEDSKGKTNFSKRIGKEIVGYGSYLIKHPVDLATIALGVPAASTTYILSVDDNLGKLKSEGKIWSDVSFFPPSRGYSSGHLDSPQLGSRHPNAADVVCLATIPMTIALMAREGVRYYKCKKSNKQ